MINISKENHLFKLWEAIILIHTLGGSLLLGLLGAVNLEVSKKLFNTASLPFVMLIFGIVLFLANFIVIYKAYNMEKGSVSQGAVSLSFWITFLTLATLIATALVVNFPN